MASPRRRLDQTGRVLIAPSLLAADFAQLREQVQLVEGGEADLLHLDVMDGHFVPNLSFGVPVIDSIRPITDLFLDTHLMITNPGEMAEAFAKAGSDGITFHIEVAEEPHRLIQHLRELRVSVGVTMNPATPAETVFEIIDQVDMVLVMSVWPGFGGQEFIEDVLPKIRELRRRLRPDQRLEVDGGIDLDTIGPAVAAGVDTVVAGSSIFRRPDPSAAIARLRQLAEDNAR